MSDLTPSRNGSWITPLVIFCQLLPLFVSILLMIWGTRYLYQGELDAGAMTWLSAVALLLIFGLKIFPQLRQDCRDKRLSKHGVAVEGEIIHSEFSGTVINNLPQYRLQIRYQHPDTGQEYTATTLLTVDYSVATSLTPGKIVPLKISRKQPEHIAIS